MLIVILKQTPNGLAKTLEDLEIRKLQLYQDRLEFWEEFWRLEETCCLSNPSEKPSA